MTARIEVQKVGVRNGFLGLGRAHETWKPNVEYKRVYWKVYIRLASGLAWHLRDCKEQGEVAHFTKGLAEATEIVDYPF